MSLGFLAAPSPGQARIAADGVVYAIPVLTMRDIPFRTVVRQQYDYSCGSAALATLLRYHYRLAVDEAMVFREMYAICDQAQIHKVGFSLLDMKKYLVAHGFAADGYRMSLDELAKVDAPAITVISIANYKHFAVIKGVNARQVLLGDPAAGLRRISRADFARIWSGIVFVARADGVSPVYNAAEEWRPWAQPPEQAKLDEGALATTNIELPTVYQIVQTNPMQSGP